MGVLPATVCRTLYHAPRDYPLLLEDLAALLPDRSMPIILLKANVCWLLDETLTHDEFNVLNKGIPSASENFRFRGKSGRHGFTLL